jgi:hypothetical protein
MTVFVPEGYHPPFAVVSPRDHTAWIVIATTLGLVNILLFAAIRFFLRLTTTQTLGRDDALIAIATVCASRSRSSMVD